MKTKLLSASQQIVYASRRMLGGKEMECCADCGGMAGEGGISLKACKACWLVKYCNADCQKNHWPRHKKDCKQRAAELHDEALFKDPPAKEDCPICFLPMPTKMICCVSLPPATISSVPIAGYAEANEELADEDMEVYYPCCGKSVCVGCVYSFHKSGKDDKCPFCNADQDKTDEEAVEELMKRTAANDATSMCGLAYHYYHGKLGLQQDLAKGVELYIRAAGLGSSQAHYNLGNEYHQRGDLKKAKIHFEAGAMAGHEGARNMLGNMEFESGKQERAVKHWIIAASAGDYGAMYNLQQSFEFGFVGRGVIDPTLTAYNTFCAKMRSEARDAHIKMCIEN